MTNIFEELSEFSLREHVATESSAYWKSAACADSERIGVRSAYRLEEPAEHKPTYNRGKVDHYKVVKGGTKALYLSYALLNDGGMTKPGTLPDTFESITIEGRTFNSCRRLKHPSLPQSDGEGELYTVEVFLFESD